eukprot:TRINITY_DN5673_c0_g1::TRINITY_DN5673_c0_g1_i1::g.12047::m.12047 TRINITY_DN5673_c0_g1::TRINITY_DN5673_c0_g1_i1::g.12047  ORF type:complete len:117 (+),score=22.24 TRINITY_DN5673_c0_g1_i1:3-353(+)
MEFVRSLETNAERLGLDPYVLGPLEQEDMLTRIGTLTLTWQQFESVMSQVCEDAFLASHPPPAEVERTVEDEINDLPSEQAELRRRELKYHGTGAMDGLHFGYLTGEKEGQQQQEH